MTTSRYNVQFIMRLEVEYVLFGFEKITLLDLPEIFKLWILPLAKFALPTLTWRRGNLLPGLFAEKKVHWLFRHCTADGCRFIKKKSALQKKKIQRLLFMRCSYKWIETQCTLARGRSIKGKSTSLLQKLPNNTIIKVEYSYVILNIDIQFLTRKNHWKNI